MANPKGSGLGGRKRIYGKDIRDKMRELYNQGVTSPRRIAYILGLSHMTVRREFGTTNSQ